MNYLLEAKLDHDILAAEIGKLFGLKLTAKMISQDGLHYESGPSGNGVLKVQLMKAVDAAAINEVMRKARPPERVHHRTGYECDSRCLPDCPGRDTA